jgi:GNAT superfamily N-acetyltransferase
LYQDDPNWIPPLRDNQKRLLGWKRHAFYEHAEAESFVARRAGDVVGRIAAIVDRAHCQTHGEHRGFFGFFECTDDREVAGALLTAAEGWLASKGMTCVRGPMNPSMNYECGLLVEGFDRPPTFMMTYNRPYYGALLESCGLVKCHDLLAYEGHLDQLPEVANRLGPLADQAQERAGATLRGMNRARFGSEVELFLRLYNGAMAGHWGFVPLSERETRDLAASMKHLLVPEMALVVEVEGRPVGAVVGLPDFNPAIREINGRLFPFGFFKLLWAKKHVKRIRVLSINVLPEFQRWGLGLVLMKGLVPKAIEMNVQEAEFSWILESNDLARMGLKKGGAVITRTYRLYDKSF